MMIDGVLLVESRERQRFERRQVRPILAEHRCPADVIVAVVVEDRGGPKLDPTHDCENQDEGRGDLKTAEGQTGRLGEGATGRRRDRETGRRGDRDRNWASFVYRAASLYER